MTQREVHIDVPSFSEALRRAAHDPVELDRLFSQVVREGPSINVEEDLRRLACCSGQTADGVDPAWDAVYDRILLGPVEAGRPQPITRSFNDLLQVRGLNLRPEITVFLQCEFLAWGGSGDRPKSPTQGRRQFRARRPPVDGASLGKKGEHQDYELPDPVAPLGDLAATVSLATLRMISQNFSPAGVMSPFLARAMPTERTSFVPVNGR